MKNKNDILYLLKTTLINNFASWAYTLPVFFIVVMCSSWLNLAWMVDITIWVSGLSTGWVTGLGGAYIFVKYNDNKNIKIEL